MTSKNQLVQINFLRILALLFSALGIGATFMPWIHYPKGNGIVYGYFGDGIITGFLYFLIFTYGLFTLRKVRIKWIPAFLVLLLSIFLVWISYTSIQEIEAEKLTFQTQDPIIASVTAGFYQGIGLYTLGIAGLGVFLTVLTTIIQQFRNFRKFENKTGTSNSISKSNALAASGILLFVFLVGWFYIRPFSIDSKPETDILETRFSEDIDQMGKFLSKGDYDSFIAFIHPMLVQNYGGREELKYILEKSLLEFRQQGFRIKQTKFGKISDLESKGKTQQAVITQELTLEKNGNDSIVNQKILALSDDSGENWYYLNIDHQTKNEISKFYPYLLQDIDF